MKARHWLCILVGAAGASCAPAERAEGERMAPQPDRVAAPSPADISVHITADQAGQAIAVPIGARFAVELVGVPTAGYVWRAARVPDFLVARDERSGPTTAAQRQPGFAGGSHWEVFVFEAAGPGRAELAFEQVRPWESAEPPSATFAVTIEAR